MIADLSAILCRMERPQANGFEIAKRLFAMSFRGEVTHTETGEQFNVLDPRYRELDVADVTGIYEHYKSTPESKKHYYVDSVRYDTESEECFVVYMSVYELNDPTVYARPLDMFMGIVDVDGAQTTRFRRLDPTTL